MRLSILATLYDPGTILETDAARAEVVNDVDEMAQVAAQPIELPDNQGLPRPKRTSELGSKRTFLFSGHTHTSHNVYYVK
jgi:hypothetical protein